MKLHESPTELVHREAEARDARLERAEAKARGVVHTSPLLARFAVRALDEALKRSGRRGLMDPDVVVVEPACGPGVFVAALLELSHDASRPRAVIGFDVDAEALASADRILGPHLRRASIPYRFERLNSLASTEVLREAEKSGSTVVVVGNPPWASKSLSRQAGYGDELLSDFHAMPDGTPLGEKKIGVLSDEYVRFFRWSAEMVRRAEGGGALGLFTNASFLDGPVHRAMRAWLLTWFDWLDVVDFGGSALIARSGRKDHNVFGVRPKVCFTLAARRRDADESSKGSVHYYRLFGDRESKEAGVRAGVPRGEQVPTPAPFYPFVPREEPQRFYLSWPSLSDLFPFHREGVQTNRDAFCVDSDRQRLLARLHAFARGETGPWPGRADVRSAHYDPEKARARLRRALEHDPLRCIQRLAYRPGRNLYFVNVSPLCHRPRPALLKAVSHSQLCLLSVRKDRGERPWAHFGTTRHAVDNSWLSTRSSCRTRAFPSHGPDGEANVDQGVFARAWAHLPDVPRKGGELLLYALGIIAAPAYRTRFDAHLRLDYPRIPPPNNELGFRAVVEAGRQLDLALRRPKRGGLARDTSFSVEIGHHRLDGEGAAAIRGALSRCDEALKHIDLCA